jgi:hypothetical protein
VVTKRIYFVGQHSDNAVFDCNGGTLNNKYGQDNNFNGFSSDSVSFYSNQKGGDKWVKGRNATLKNCIVNHGSIRLYTKRAANVNNTSIKSMSNNKTSDYKRLLAEAANDGIKILNNNIIAKVRTPIYIGAGNTNTIIGNNKFNGSSVSVAIYLEAESNRSHIYGNQFHLNSGKREVLAIDGSYDNLIENNFFSGLVNAGINLYRNCGEYGTIRHATPSNNTIRYNKFYYRKSNAKAIQLSSRDGNRKYCNADNWARSNQNLSKNTSAWSNKDHAANNNIYMNQLLNRDPKYFISEGPSAKGKNSIWGNIKVSSWVKYDRSNPLKHITGSCSRFNSNYGCTGYLSCPNGYYVVGGKANCQLEWPSTNHKNLPLPSQNGLLHISKVTDTGNGICSIGDSTHKDSIYGKGDTYADSLSSQNSAKSSIDFHCKEGDKNGGDCAIKAQVTCVKIPDFYSPPPRLPKPPIDDCWIDDNEGLNERDIRHCY